MVQFCGDVDVGQVQSTFQSWTLLQDKWRVQRTNTCDHSTTDRLNILTVEQHLREDRPDKEISEEETMEEMVAPTMSMNSSIATSRRVGVGGLMYGHPNSVLHAMSNSSHVNASTWIS